MRRLFLLFAAVVLSGCSCLPAEKSGFANAETLKQRRRACVEIISNDMIKGTGAFISEDGMIITASHLFVDDDVKVEVLSSEYGRMKAKLMRRNRVADLALVKVEKPGVNFATLPLAKNMPDQGEELGCFGAALWNPIMLLNGRVANPDPNYCEYPSSNGYMRCMFVSAAIPGLASGGPWINGRGELVGVQAGHLLDQGKDAGIAMVGSIDEVKLLLAADKSIHTAGIGAWIWPLWTTAKDIINRFPAGAEGLLVNSVHKNGPLEKAGIKQHELIVSCNGKKMRRRADLFNLIRSKAPGSKVELEVMSKGGKVRVVEIILSDTETGKL